MLRRSSWVATLAVALVVLPGCPRRTGGDDDAGPPPGTDAGYDVVGGNPFSGPLSLSDERMQALDPALLRAGDAPCREPLLARVTRVVDGDTIGVDGVSEVWAPSINIRLIGVDTPEIEHPGEPGECFGRDAKGFTEQLLGRLVWLTFDAECMDNFDRPLAYVHIGPGAGDLWERQLLRRGFAEALTIRPNDSYASVFDSDESTARSERVGLWGLCF